MVQAIQSYIPCASTNDFYLKLTRIERSLEETKSTDIKS